MKKTAACAALCLLLFLQAACTHTFVPQNQAHFKDGKARVEPPEDELFYKYWFTSRGVSPWFGAATEANYAAHFADPVELDFPAPLGDPNPLAAVGAVERYQKGQSRGIADQSIEVGTMDQ